MSAVCGCLGFDHEFGWQRYAALLRRPRLVLHAGPAFSQRTHVLVCLSAEGSTGCSVGAIAPDWTILARTLRGPTRLANGQVKALSAPSQLHGGELLPLFG
jgi:hypothetical protein